MQLVRRKKNSPNESQKRRNRQVEECNKLTANFVANLLCPAYGDQCKKCGKNKHFAVKCLADKRPSQSSRADQNLHYVDDLETSFEEYTIDVITHQISAVETNPCPQNNCSQQSR